MAAVTVKGEVDFDVDVNPLEVPVPAPTRPPGWGQRHTLVLLGFLGFSVSYALRFNLSLAIVAMVNSTKSHQPPSSSSHDLNFDPDPSNGSLSTTSSLYTCPALHQPQQQVNSQGAGSNGEFNWNEAEQGVILGSFFWGYVLTQIPGGIVSQKYGGKWPLGLGLLVTAIFAILTPAAARLHKTCLIVVRVIQGLAEVS